MRQRKPGTNAPRLPYLARPTSFLKNVKLPSLPIVLNADNNTASNITKQPMFNAQEIIPGLFLGSVADLSDCSEIKKRGITKLINVTPDPIPEYYDKLDTLCIPIKDHSDENISCYFEAAHNKILDALNNNTNILVYCHRGISRSATIVLSFLMCYGHKFSQIPKNKELNIVTYDNALDFIQKKRNISPNLGFILTLHEIDNTRGYQQDLFETVPSNEDLFNCNTENNMDGGFVKWNTPPSSLFNGDF